jgi:hypothetical protein
MMSASLRNIDLVDRWRKIDRWDLLHAIELSDHQERTRDARTCSIDSTFGIFSLRHLIYI